MRPDRVDGGVDLGHAENVLDLIGQLAGGHIHRLVPEAAGMCEPLGGEGAHWEGTGPNREPPVALSGQVKRPHLVPCHRLSRVWRLGAAHERVPLRRVPDARMCCYLRVGSCNDS